MSVYSHGPSQHRGHLWRKMGPPNISLLVLAEFLRNSFRPIVVTITITHLIIIDVNFVVINVIFVIGRKIVKFFKLSSQNQGERVGNQEFGIGIWSQSVHQNHNGIVTAC